MNARKLVQLAVEERFCDFPNCPAVQARFGQKLQARVARSRDSKLDSLRLIRVLLTGHKAGNTRYLSANKPTIVRYLAVDFGPAIPQIAERKRATLPEGNAARPTLSTGCSG